MDDLSFYILQKDGGEAFQAWANVVAYLLYMATLYYSV